MLQNTSLWVLLGSCALAASVVWLLRWHSAMSRTHRWSSSAAAPLATSVASLPRRREEAIRNLESATGRVTAINAHILSGIRTENGTPFLLAAKSFYDARCRPETVQAVKAFILAFSRELDLLRHRLGVPPSEGLGIVLHAARNGYGEIDS